MIRQTVPSDNGGKEGKWVGGIIVAILLLATVLLPFHQDKTKSQQLDAHQIAITELSPDELAMVAELRLAHEEIRNLNQDSREFDNKNHWPDMAELSELWLAPFIEDKSWERKGRHQWQHIDGAIYQGLRTEKQGASSVVLNSNSPDPDIWLALSRDTIPLVINQEAVFETQQLIDRGWTQIVFRSDSDEQIQPH
ncbi:hypothetical protein C0Z01_21165 [Photobacterium kishitanii]|uniref:DUF6162 family protein n=1 Tax=Photobacterium kishitanii TaxID=318456 RepID=UPI0007EF734C|nr:hypothetical protein [Photobacterium kishitanii]OBU28890.1 hypothetical protein AYY22_12090 [Photobacterium kishitanii]PSU16577.1 hypothetical protein CTM84_19420 [Photobacterium kishitanii]PSU87250.1 hypothetical protein C0W42_17135 [Photobacterium kishitanii]PSU90650.1 hypothetical protein C0W35_17395 [Photobacterium kishitanii]PSV11610.1 hypothetical protein C0W28_18455 [Photobacterium kishitanii]